MWQEEMRGKQGRISLEWKLKVANEDGWIV